MAEDLGLLEDYVPPFRLTIKNMLDIKVGGLCCGGDVVDAVVVVVLRGQTS